MDLGDQIRQYRKEQNLSQEQLAERLGVSRQTIYKWETGLAHPCSEKRSALRVVLGDIQQNTVVSVTVVGGETAVQESDSARLQEAMRLLEQKRKRQRMAIGLSVFGILFVCGVFSSVCLGILAVGGAFGLTVSSTYYVDPVWFYLSLLISVVVCFAKILLLIVLFREQRRQIL